MWTPSSFFICYFLILKIIRVDSAQRQKHISIQQESLVPPLDVHEDGWFNHFLIGGKGCWDSYLCPPPPSNKICLGKDSPLVFLTFMPLTDYPSGKRKKILCLTRELIPTPPPFPP